MRSLYGAAAASTAFMIVTALGGGSAFAAVGGPACNVPSDYPTIQAAVNDVGCTTISVAAGTYAESLTIARPVDLRGPNAGISALTTRVPEAVVTSPGIAFFVNNGTNVTINGFYVDADEGIYVTGASSENVAILDNVVVGTTRALTLDAPGNAAQVLGNDLISNTRSFHVSSGPYTSMKVNDNRFSGAAAATGIQFINGPSETITGFEFKANDVRHSANIGATIYSAVVSDNTFAVLSPGNLSLQIDLHNASITHNSFDGFGSTACLQLFGSQYGLLPSDHVTVSENTFQNCNDYGVQLGPDINHIYIKRNYFLSGVDGVNTRSITPWDVSGLEIHINDNNFIGNSHAGVNNTVDGVLDASCNWWGSPTGPGPVGPGLGDNVSTGVLFTPWLAAPFGKKSCDECAKKVDPCYGGHCDGTWGAPDDGQDNGKGTWNNGGGADQQHQGVSPPGDSPFVGESAPIAPYGDSAAVNASPTDGGKAAEGCNVGASSSVDVAGAFPFALMLAARMIRRRRRA